MGNDFEFNFNLIRIALQYFSAFSQKNLNALGDMFLEDVWLRDWEQYANGRAEVLAANQKIFDSVDSITVCPSYIYVDQDTVTAELLITIVHLDGTSERIEVCDVLEFTSGSIKSIRAYKG